MPVGPDENLLKLVDIESSDVDEILSDPVSETDDLVIVPVTDPDNVSEVPVVGPVVAGETSESLEAEDDIENE